MAQTILPSRYGRVTDPISKYKARGRPRETYNGVDTQAQRRLTWTPSSSSRSAMFFKSVVTATAALASLAVAAPVEGNPTADVIKGSYIVKLKDNVATDAHMSWVNGIHARSTEKAEFAGVKYQYTSKASMGILATSIMVPLPRSCPVLMLRTSKRT
ncbi:Oryzin [Purpureocillium takamizusanense]|uniref:Oryzin n=1 Tax=Purpureocillium takamizusanense TaxID=2060973 RepID=A0A9Q8QUJ0_9HYPO|nr:Oryzin [Purpureocillium takamizusanense]UNI24742.1 Oryzin [Purpureocillium takamizusanense]